MLECLPLDRRGRWEWMASFLARWHAPLTPEDGYADRELDAAATRLGIPLPRALREWYGLAGRLGDVWSRQDELLPPSEICIDDDVLIFYVENQAVVRWGIPCADLDRDDPPVVVESSDSSGEWLVENTTTSEFALQMLVYATKYSKRVRFWENDPADEDSLHLIEAHYPRLPFPGWHWPDGPTRFFGRDDIIIEVNGAGEGLWLHAWSDSEVEFRTFRDLLRESGLEWGAAPD